MQRRLLDVRQIHRHLRDPILLYEPADSFDVLQRARNANRFAICIQHRFSPRRAVFCLRPPLLAHIKRDRGRAPHRLRVQVYVISDQEIADTDYGGARFLIENGRTEIRFPFQLLYFFEEPFVLSCANH